jgi:hypothetical protein
VAYLTGGSVPVFNWRVATTVNFLPRPPRFDSMSGNVGSVVEKVAPG